MVATKRQYVGAFLIAAISFVAGAALSSARVHGQSPVPQVQSRAPEGRARKWEYRIAHVEMWVGKDNFKAGEDLANSLAEQGFEMAYVDLNANHMGSLVFVFRRPKPE